MSDGERACDIADSAHRCVAARLRAFAAAPGVAVRRGDGWFAVRTGADSNDMNGVVSIDGAPVPVPLIADLTMWLTGVPASWLILGTDRHLTTHLLDAGARSERDGRWSGAELSVAVQCASGAASITRVTTPADLDRWLDAADACGWVSSATDRIAQHDLYVALLRPDSPLQHWIALDGVETVGFASSFLDGRVMELAHLGVVPAHRREGIGGGLTATLLEDAALRGADLVISAPSPDGWALQRTLGFTSVPMVPDTTFYLPT